MSEYRSSNRIIQSILECIYERGGRERVLKTHIIQFANLKTPMAERYLELLAKAGYIEEKIGAWGDRTVTYYELTELGRERHTWFARINAELYEEEKR